MLLLFNRHLYSRPDLILTGLRRKNIRQSGLIFGSRMAYTGPDSLFATQRAQQHAP